MLRDPSYSRDWSCCAPASTLQMKDDGTLSGYVGGYRPWEPVYKGWVNARGPVIESLTWVQLPAVYYALRRNADYSPKGAKARRRTSLSRCASMPCRPTSMTPDASHRGRRGQIYKALAAVEEPTMAALPFNIVDGIVIERNAPVQAGPNAVILPPQAGGGTQ